MKHDTWGLFQMGRRSYSATTGRLTEVDSLPASAYTYSCYAYAGDNSANFIDPSGLLFGIDFGECAEQAAFGAIGGALAGVVVGLTPLAPLTPATVGIGALGGGVEQGTTCVLNDIF